MLKLATTEDAEERRTKPDLTSVSSVSFVVESVHV